MKRFVPLLLLISAILASSCSKEDIRSSLSRDGISYWSNESTCLAFSTRGFVTSYRFTHNSSTHFYYSTGCAEYEQDGEKVTFYPALELYSGVANEARIEDNIKMTLFDASGRSMQVLYRSVTSPLN